MSIKKTCNRCRAFDHENGKCDLGYKLKYTRTPLYYNGKEQPLSLVKGKPLEECPKPLTIFDLITARKNVNIRQNDR